VCLSVLFFSFSVLGVLFSPIEFQLCFKEVLRVFEDSRVLKKSLGCSKEVSIMFKGSFKGVYKYFKEVQRVFKEALRVFQGSSREI